VGLRDENHPQPYNSVEVGGVEGKRTATALNTHPGTKNESGRDDQFPQPSPDTIQQLESENALATTTSSPPRAVPLFLTECFFRYDSRSLQYN